MLNINMDTLRKGVNLKESKSLLRIAENGQDKMYKYLSGADDNSTYTAQNIKYIMDLHGNVNWNKIEDKTNALFSIGYSDQGNIIGLLTNTNALLQDMLMYSTLEDAKNNLREVLSLEVGSKSIPGKRYLVNGQSPLTFSLPVITQGKYKTLAVVIHKAHADRFKEIMKYIDVDALTMEDMYAISKDFSFISRTQELAIDVAKDKTIEIVDTSEWVNTGIKPANYWLGKQSNVEGWYAKDNLSEILTAKKDNKQLPEFNIEKVVPEHVEEKINKEVTTSESVAREVLYQATKDYFNNSYKDMLLYSTETELNQRAKSYASENPKLSAAIKQVLMAYRSYMIDNIPKEAIEDKETAMLLRKLSKEKTNKFAAICRNTIYKLGQVEGLNAYYISLIAYGTDLTEVSVDEGKMFRAVMPEEFKKLYSNGKSAINREKLFFVDDFIKDMMDDGEEYVLNFSQGQAFDQDGILIAKASFKYNAKDAKIVFEENTGIYYAETTQGIDLPAIGEEVLVRIENPQETILNTTVTYISKTPSNHNLLYTEEYGNKIIHGALGYRNSLPLHYKVMLINNDRLKEMARNKQMEHVETLVSDYNYVQQFGLINNFIVKELITTNKDTDFESHFVIINIK